MAEQKKPVGWATVAVIIGFIVYEAATIVFQFSLLIMGDLIEIGFDLLFILLLVFFYDVDALILLIELIPFVDLIPLFVIYMIIKVSTADEPRKPLISMEFGLFKGDKGEEQRFDATDENAHPLGDITEEEKIYQATSEEEVCVICMQLVQDGDEVITCVNGHLVHVRHIRPWTESMDREFCPVCRVKYPRVLISKTYRKLE
ncbi:MAG: E3 ubiquitin protein ligase [Candidatus Helarchaeota archaeon]|nr:E3 ubiquitin protein ligase [Candidatus Helarchaeota archaeon]